MILPYLFNPDIKGIKLNVTEYLISQYADDSALTLADDLDSLNSSLPLRNVLV
jgi:hypothetical protein